MSHGRRNTDFNDQRKEKTFVTDPHPILSVCCVALETVVVSIDACPAIKGPLDILFIIHTNTHDVTLAIYCPLNGVVKHPLIVTAETGAPPLRLPAH